MVMVSFKTSAPRRVVFRTKRPENPVDHAGDGLRLGVAPAPPAPRVATVPPVPVTPTCRARPEGQAALLVGVGRPQGAAIRTLSPTPTGGVPATRPRRP